MKDKHTTISLWLDYTKNVASHVTLRDSLRKHKQEQYLLTLHNTISNLITGILSQASFSHTI